MRYNTLNEVFMYFMYLCDSKKYKSLTLKPFSKKMWPKIETLRARFIADFVSLKKKFGNKIHPKIYQTVGLRKLISSW